MGGQLVHLSAGWSVRALVRPRNLQPSLSASVLYLSAHPSVRASVRSPSIRPSLCLSVASVRPSVHLCVGRSVGPRLGWAGAAGGRRDRPFGGRSGRSAGDLLGSASALRLTDKHK